MKVLITGVAGFIGSNLANSLLQMGYEVFGIDNFSFGHQRNLAAFISEKRFHFIFGDLMDFLLLKDLHVDIIVHLASQKIPRYTSALRTLGDNHIMLQNIIKKCVVDNSRIIFASTSDVYGKNDKLPFCEESDLVMGPTNVKRWAYACSKIFGEQYIIAHHDECGLEYTIARFFGSYGPNQNLTWWGGPQAVFINKAFLNQEMEIHGDGMQTRTFTYIDDTIAGLMKCIFEEKAINEIFNIGSDLDSEISILDLGNKIWRLINGETSVSKIKFVPYSIFGNYEDVRRRIPDITKIRNLLGYNPNTSLTDGLVKTIKWQKGVAIN